jgi:predicted nucleic acid-binding protein
VILIDTSAWVEFLRDTRSPACEGVDRLLAGEVATCHPVRMEVLAGARDPRHLQQLRRLLGRATIIPTLPSDFEDAAALYRLCRQQGRTVRRLLDCLIAAHAIRAGVPLLHADSDFDALARCSELQVVSG